MDGVLNDSVSWDVTQTPPPPATPPKFLTQGPAINEAIFSIPVTLQSGTSAVQNVTFQVTAVGFGTRPVTLADGTTPLQGTFTVAQAGLTVNLVNVIQTGTNPVDAADVTFSQAIDTTTFNVDNGSLTLTRGPNNTNVPLTTPPVTFDYTNNPIIHITGLTNFTTAQDTYALTVDATKVKNAAGVLGTNSQTANFIVSTAPTIASVSQPTSPSSTPVSSVVVTFTAPIDPATFTTAALGLTRDGKNVPLTSPPVTITPTDTTNTTFTVSGLGTFTTPEGAYVLTVSPDGIKAADGTTAVGGAPVSVNFTIDTGPKVVKLLRYGFHNEPTLLVLTFDRALTPASAGDPNNYSVLTAGHNGRRGPRGNVVVPIVSGAYSAANNTVTLLMGKQLSFFQPYILIARGTGKNPISDNNGIALDGKGNGQAGTDFVTIFNHRIVAGPAAAGSTTTQVQVTTTTTNHIPNTSVTTNTTTFNRMRPSQVIQTV